MLFSTNSIATHAQGCFLFDFDEDRRIEGQKGNPSKSLQKEILPSMLFCCDISIFSIVFIARFESFRGKSARDALFTFHSQLQRIHLNWPDISDIHFEKFLFTDYFSLGPVLLFFPSFSFESCRSHFYFNLFWQDFRLNSQQKNVGGRENLWGNLQWDHFRYIFFFCKKRDAFVAWKEQVVWLMVDWML